MKQTMKFWTVLLAAALGAGMARADAGDPDTGVYLYWMVGEDYAAKSGLGDDWAFQGAQLVAVMNDDTKVSVGAEQGGFYAQASDPNADAPDRVQAFAGGALKAVLPLGDASTSIKGFYVEFYNYNSAAESGQFELMGFSSMTDYEDFSSFITDLRNEKNPHVATPGSYYSPNGYHANVPEPSSGLLLLVGAALLGLKRRPRA